MQKPLFTVNCTPYNIVCQAVVKTHGFDSARGKIITWNGIIIDGHNRYEICTKHNIKFETEEKSFDDRTDVKIWIIHNQLDRRNITDFVRTELVLALKDEIAKKAKLKQSEFHGNQYTGGLKEKLPEVQTHQRQSTVWRNESSYCIFLRLLFLLEYDII